MKERSKWIAELSNSITELSNWIRESSLQSALIPLQRSVIE